MTDLDWVDDPDLTARDILRRLSQMEDVTIVVDPAACAAYASLGGRAEDGAVSHTREVRPGVLVDLDGAGVALGVELLDSALVDGATG